MRPLLRLRLFVVALLCLASWRAAPRAAETSPAVASTERVVTLRADPSCPQNCDPDSDHPGYVIEMARRIFGDAGMTVDYKLLSWSRTLVEVRNGHIDASVAGIRADAPDFVYPQETVGILQNGFALRKGGNWRWTGPQSLEGMVLGAIPDYQYFPEIKAYIDAHADDPKRVQMVAMFDALELNLKKLSIGRIDVVCDDLATIRYYIHRLGLADKLEASGPVGPQVDQYVAFTPATPRGRRLAAIWDAGVRKLRASGELKTILDRYTAVDWK